MNSKSKYNCTSPQKSEHRKTAETERRKLLRSTETNRMRGCLSTGSVQQCHRAGHAPRRCRNRPKKLYTKTSFLIVHVESSCKSLPNKCHSTLRQPRAKKKAPNAGFSSVQRFHCKETCTADEKEFGKINKKIFHESLALDYTKKTIASNHVAIQSFSNQS